MKRLAAFVLFFVLSLPAAAQLQYFGYVGGADDDFSLNALKGFANFAHLSTPQDLASTWVLNRVNAMAPRGQKAIIDLGYVLWCDPDGNGSYRRLCSDWVQRWTTWKTNNASILTADKVLAFIVLDEPFNRGAVMSDYETATLRVKADYPWAKTLLVEAACVVSGTCQSYWPSPGVGGYAGSLPGVDWLGVDAYGIHPSTDSSFQSARSIMKNRFPGKKWIYVADGYWDPGLQGVSFTYIENMGQIADEWYSVASSDPDAVLLGVYYWSNTGGTTSEQFTCGNLTHHVAIGKAITQKVRPQTALPVGTFSVGSNGLISGWACDPDATLCERPRIDIYSDGVFFASVNYPETSPQMSVLTNQCASGIAYNFTLGLNVGQSGRQITAIARDLDSGSVALPNTCPSSVCVFYTQFYSPKGYLENVDSSGVAYGWVCDPDAPQVSSQVRLLAAGSQVGVYTTNLSNEQAVTNACGGGTLHRFAIQLPASARGQQITAYAENLGSPIGGNDVKLTVLCSNGVCIWR